VSMLKRAEWAMVQDPKKERCCVKLRRARVTIKLD